MAKQIGDIVIKGTIGGITFYVMEGKGYARMKTSLTGKRVKRDPRFKRTMQSAHRLARGSQLASKVYRSLPRTEQLYALYKELTRIAVRALKEGASEAEVISLLLQRTGKANATERMAFRQKEKEKAHTPLPHFTRNLFVPFLQSGTASRKKVTATPAYVLRE